MTRAFDESDWRLEKVLKRDLFGEIQLGRLAGHEAPVIRRLVKRSAWLMRPLARLFAWRERRALERLVGVAGVPQLIGYERGVLYRSFMPGVTVAQARPRDPAFYGAMKRLMRQVHLRGVAHNDAAKRVNWLVLEDGSPGLIDFQLSLVFRRRHGRLFRLARREDLRHILKHKKFNIRQAMTAREKRMEKRRSWIGWLWRWLYKRPYLFVTRRILGWADREGQGLGAELDRGATRDWSAPGTQRTETEERSDDGRQP